MKHEWRKHEKGLYLPKDNPVFIDIPKMVFLTIQGRGNPNSTEFSVKIGALYAVSYAIKMCYKTDDIPKGYYDYTVYPLEGVWDIADEAKENFTGTIDKDDLVYEIMIRQPDFIDEGYALRKLEQTKQKKPNQFLERIHFTSCTEGKCVQMLHNGYYENEPGTFQLMEEFCKENNYQRISKIHREIYLNDTRKTQPENLKTVLRFKVE